MAEKEKARVKIKSLKEIDSKFEELFGKDTTKMASEIDANYDICSLDSITLDGIMGIGGLPKGRLVEIIGWESSGKTSLCLEYIAQEHKRDKDAQCAFIDCEHTLDINYAESIGVDLNRLRVATPMNGEDAFDMLTLLTESGLYEIIGFDSIAATIPKKQMEGKMEDKVLLLHSRLVNRGIETIAPIASKANTLILLTNQFREKVGVMFGDNAVTKGGNAPKFYCSIRINISRSVSKKNSYIEDGEMVSNLTKIKVIKNKMAPPFRTGEFYMRYSVGIDRLQEIASLGVEQGVITKTGRSYFFNDIKLCMGLDNIRPYLAEHPDICKEIKEKIKNSYKVKAYEPSIVEKLESVEEEN